MRCVQLRCDMIAAFLEHLRSEKQYASHTIMAYENDLRQYADYLSQEYEAAPHAAHRTMIRSWLAYLLQQGYAASSVHRKLSTLQSYYKYLVQQSVLTESPVFLLTLPKPKPAPTPHLSAESLWAVLWEYPYDGDYAAQQAHTIVTVLYATGMRRAELIGLKMKDIDTASGMVKVLGKGNKERLLPLVPLAQQHIAAYIKVRNATFETDDYHLFLTVRGRPLYPKAVYRAVRDFLGRITTATHRSPHVLRHAFATHLLDGGSELYAVKDLLGHASLAATQRYTHPSLAQLKDVYRRAHPKGDEPASDDLRD